MPQPETIVLNPTVVAQARHDHILRSQNRISQFQQKLATGVVGDERALIETEVAKLETQVEAARHPHPIEASGKAEVGGLVQMVQTLTAEVASLKAALTQPNKIEQAA